MTIDPHDIIPSDGSEPQPAPAPDFQDFELPGSMPEGNGASGGLEAVHDVPVKVQAVLGRARMPIGDLLALSAGTVLELDRRVGEPVDIFVNDRLIARGEVVLIDNALGVTLTEIVRPDR
ncbi:flagellar motor switch protein FliN [Sphingomonas sp. ABOLD]|uniref:Flagellar motor switch protein FliN n=1 Tax=Sphingomonas trueperi TaxID=53317 RepID=A0A7X6BCV9_9SPHN|nr:MULTISPECIES: flagellar motor switch protein FliN [Sphingomonas]NJB97650.1 flagellar motor switch protein FliN/FliY [Sphingomonas trueperi]RSV43535.1 flagellar motor switch protein FliN [Sphingomonas sp. ABOLE]RSV52856.1 flagellar motor switch protein FliN [Sphingomonas sp. ABOLD]